MDISALLGRPRQPISINQLLRNQLLWMLVLRIVLYTLLMAISYIFRNAQVNVIVLPSNLQVLFLLFVYLSTIASAFFLITHEGNLRIFGFTQNFLDTFFVAILVFFSGSSQSIFTSVFFFPIVAGGLILPRKGGLVAASSATLFYGAILFAENYGIYPQYLRNILQFAASNPELILNHFAVQGLTFFLAAMLSAIFGLRLQKTESALNDSLKSYDSLSILYKQIFDNISTGIITIDTQHVITSANNAIERITGIKPFNLIGKNLDLVFADINLSGESERQTTDFQRNDGSVVRIGYSHIDIDQAAIHDTSQPPPHKIITLKDISEIEKLERQLRHTEKLAAIGMMSASIAHDFRNPLTAISGSAQVLANEYRSKGEDSFTNYQLTNIILRESNRLIETIGDFLRFSRPEKANCSWFSFQRCLEEVLEVCKADPNWPPTMQIQLEFRKTLDLWADEKEMFTVFTHLILNSVAFCPPGNEVIVIRAREKKGSNGSDTVEITFEDNGSGIKEENREQIFEPFFTTRTDGTGLGLAIVKQTITEHDGAISAGASRLGGAAIILVLPLPQI